MPDRLPRKLTAILYADVAGYSRLTGADEDATHRLLREYLELISLATEEQGGQVVHYAGDAVLASFGAVVDALACAKRIQAMIAERNSGMAENSRIEFRIGINLGDVIEDRGDIYGDGVNVAARLESLADPGGICISESVRTAVGGKLDVEYAFLGEREMKNIRDPVRVYKVIMASGVASREAPQFTLPEKPSIAVLPFTNMSGDSEQEYFSDGITEDIITELSRFPELFVIARNSSFVFKNQPVDIKEVARKLGIQYVVEGSVRKAGQRVRITAQLVDAIDGSHLWADKYDRHLEDIFELQDEVVRSIVSVLPGRVAEAGARWSRRKPAENLSAFDYLLRANSVLNRRGENISRAIELYRQAIALDPDCAAAYAGIAIAEGMSVWDLSSYNDNPLERAYENARRAVELDSGDYRSHAAFGDVMRQLGRHALARQHLEQAMALNPNSTRVLGSWAMLLAYTGKQPTAIETYNLTIRLDPFGQDSIRKDILAESYYMMREYEKSLTVLESMLKLPIFYVHQQMAMCYAQLGEVESCKRSLARYRAELPETYDEKLLRESHLRLCERQEDRQLWTQGYELIARIGRSGADGA